MTEDKEKKLKIRKGIINNNELIELFGTKKNKEYFKDHNKILSSTKNSILNKASRYCDIIDLGNGKYQINKVYTNPKPLTLNKMQNGLYQYMSPLILLKLLKGHDKNNKVVFPLLDWALYIDMINKNYKPMKYNQNNTSEYLNINVSIVNEFFEKIDENIRYYIENCLEYLRKADVLVWYKVPMLRKRVIERSDSNNKDINIKCSYIDVRATDEEIKYIIDTSELIRSLHGIKNKSECFYGSKAEIYRRELQNKLIQQDILYSYDSYEVYYTNKTRCNNLLKEFTYINEKELIDNFNKYFIENIVISNAEKRQANEIIKQYRLDKNYIANFQTLSELTLDNQQKQNIAKEIKTTIDKSDRMKDDFNFKIVYK